MQIGDGSAQGPGVSPDVDGGSVAHVHDGGVPKETRRVSAQDGVDGGICCGSSNPHPLFSEWVTVHACHG
jgi:hypothetical protein